MQGIFITVVSTIVIAIAQPVWFHADVGLLAFQMIGRTGCVHGTAFVGLVGCNVVLAIIDTVADQVLGDATVVGTGELTLSTRRINAAFLITAIATIVLVITFPGFEDASAVVASKFVGATRVVGTVIGVLVGTVSAVIVAVTGPHPRYTTTIPAGKLAGVTGDILWHAHPVFIHKPTVVIAFAFNGSIHAWMARLIASTLEDIARVYFALLSTCRINMQISWRIIQSFH